MIKLISNMDSGTTKTPTCKSQQRQIGIAMRKIKHDEFKISHGHFYSTGFIRRDKNIVYFSTSDFRYFPNSAMARYADTFGDYNGRGNISTSMVELDKLVDNLLKRGN